MGLVILILIFFVAFGVFALVERIAVDILGFRMMLGLIGIACGWQWWF